MSALHELKSPPQAFHALWSSRKTFEIRFDDGYQVADVLHVREWIPADQKYSGRSLLVMVIHLEKPNTITDGCVAMSLKLLTRLDGETPCGMEGKK